MIIKMLLFFLFLFGSFLRFYQIGSVPPMSQDAMSGRLFSVFIGSISIIYIYLLTFKLFNNKNISLFTSLFYAVLPINIVENRIVSWVTGANFAILTILLLYYQKNKYYKYIAIIAALVIIILFIPYYLQLYPPVFSINNFSANLISFISFNKLFFHNDSYWVGGIRKYGFMNAELIPIFFIGLYQIIKSKKHILIFPLLVIILVSLNVKYPEAREAGLVSPFLSIILGLGLFELICFIKKINKLPGILARIFFSIYVLILCYGMLNFFHNYQIHYTIQIKNENLYLKYRF